MSHITVPTMDKTNASNAKGSPNKNPNGLQSPIVFLSCSWVSITVEQGVVLCDMCYDFEVTMKRFLDLMRSGTGI
jgi:hypothetical protein